MTGSSIIVNNRVALAGTASHAAVGATRLLYIANRPGAVKLKSEDDLRVERENALMAQLGYIGFRPGSVAERNAGHALFDASGIPERIKVQRELLATSSAVITSVISVRNEDAERLGLLTKQQWERAVRAAWPRYVESLGVIAPEDIRYVCAMHVSQTSRHVHILTWDQSGAFNRLLPKEKMVAANEELARQILKPLREPVNMLRTETRDALVDAVKEAVLKDAALKERVAAALPATGSLKYGVLARRHPGARDEVDAAVAHVVSENRDARALQSQWREAVMRHAELKGLKGAALEAHVSAAESDLRTRLGNAAVAAARQGPATERLTKREAQAESEPLLSPEMRRRERALVEEASSLLGEKESDSIFDALRSGKWSQRHTALIERLPSAKALLRISPSVPRALRGLASIIARAAMGPASSRGRQDLSEQAGRQSMRMLCLLARVVIFGFLKHRAASTHPTPKHVDTQTVRKASTLRKGTS